MVNELEEIEAEIEEDAKGANEPPLVRKDVKEDLVRENVRECSLETPLVHGDARESTLETPLVDDTLEMVTPL